MKIWVTVLIFFVFFTSRVWSLDLSFHGFLQGNYSVRVTGEEFEGPEDGDFLLAEERFQARLSGTSQSGNSGFFIKADFFHDDIINDFDIDIREAYIDYLSERYEARVGRQIITWGVGDLLFINDIFPKDYVAFFSGRPLEYLKIGSDALKVSLYPDFVSAELVVIPFFEANNLPTGTRFFVFDPFPQIRNRETEEPSTEVENTEVAARIYRNIWNFDISLYAFRGFFRTPAMRPDNPGAPTKIISFFPELLTYGLSLQRGLLGGVVSVEGGYYDSKEDREGTDPFIPNSLSKYLVGYQRQLWRDFTIGLQYYGEFMAHHDEYVETLPQGFRKLDEYRDLVTIRLTQLLKHQTLKLSLFAFYSPSDEDYLVIPEVKYNFTDELSLALGGNIFGGDEDAPQLGQFDLNDNVYTVIRYEF